LRQFASVHADAAASLDIWFSAARTTQWTSLVDVRGTYRSTDLVGRLTVFNIGGNKYRLIAYIDYASRKVFVRSILTHSEYELGKWKDDPWNRD
jgi:mRNA interferase HigB